MGPWAVLVCLVLLLLFRFLPSGSGTLSCGEGLERYIVQKGDNCWDLSQDQGISVQELVDLNTGLDCESLWADQQICLPQT